MFRVLMMCFIVSLMACGAQEKQPAATALPTGKVLPSIPLEELKFLYEKCDYIDYIFYTTNFSVSQNTQESIRAALAHIAKEVPESISPVCKPIGRLYYQVEGKNVLEADIYYQEECAYLAFRKDNKQVYANKFTEGGITYFNNIFQNVKQQQQKIQQEQQQGQ